MRHRVLEHGLGVEIAADDYVADVAMYEDVPRLQPQNLPCATQGPEKAMTANPIVRAHRRSKGSA